MPILQSILNLLYKARKENKLFDLTDTLNVLKAVQHVSKNKILVQKAIQLIQLIEKKEEYFDTLSKRENEIFWLIGMGLSSKEIGNSLSISEATVATHRKHIIRKLELSGYGQLQKITYQVIQQYQKI